MPPVIAEEYFDGVVLVVACKVDVGGDVALLQSGIQDPEVVADRFGLQFLAIVGICQAICDAFEFGCSEGAEVADLIEEVAADFEVFVDGRVQAGV